MNQYKTKKSFQSPSIRSQFFILNYFKKSYKEFAIVFGWINKDDSKDHIKRATQRIKNIKRSLEEFGIVFPSKKAIKEGAPHYLKIDEKKFKANRTRKGYK